MNQKVILIILAVILIVAGAVFYISTQKEQETQESIKETSASNGDSEIPPVDTTKPDDSVFFEKADISSWKEAFNGYLYPPGWSVNQADAGGKSGVYFSPQEEFSYDDYVLSFLSVTAKVDFFDFSENPELRSFEEYVESSAAGAETEEVMINSTSAIKAITEEEIIYIIDGGEWFKKIVYKKNSPNKEIIEKIISANID